MIPPLFGADGKPIGISKRIGKGGEGEVYAVDGKANLAVKIYTVQNKASREAKVRRMIADQLFARNPLIAFPRDLVFDKAGCFLGFTMPLVAGHQPLFELYSPGARKAAFPQANFRFLVVAAANIARAIGMTHASGTVVGDINHSGILVSPKALVTLIDADSFQVAEGSRHHYCTVGVPEYTPPELQGSHLDGIVRTPNHDGFGLAVAIFLLLFMGRHPYGGKFAGGDLPLPDAIKGFRFAYSRGRSVAMATPPGVPTLDDFPASIGAAFEAAFGPEGRQTRPTAKQWISLLEELKDALKVCSKSPLHHYSASARECPWCRMESRFAVPLFLPLLPAFDPSAPLPSTFGDVLTIWRAIEAVQPPPMRMFPQYTGSAPTPDAIATEMANTRKFKRIGGWTLAGIAVVLPFTVPDTLMWSLIMGGAAWWLLASKSTGDEEVIKNYRAIQTRLLEAEAEWDKQNNGFDFLELKADLRKKKLIYEGLPQEQKDRLDEYGRNRRSAQLRSYLDAILIRKWKIPKVGPGRQAILLSYGIETAADVTQDAVLRVPGFGPKTSQPLLNWRRHMEARFQYNPAPNQADNAAAHQIRTDIAKKAAELKLELSTGPAKLTQLGAAIKAKQAASTPFVETILKTRAQAVSDMEELGLKLPDIPKPTASIGTTSQFKATFSTPPVTGVQTNQSKRCPNCGGAMVIRTAGRGPRRGSQFYGCTKYPACRGTRQYP